MLLSFKRLFRAIEARNKKQLAWVLIVSLTSTIIQTLGIVSILPFIAVMMDTSIVETQAPLRWVRDTLGFASDQSFLIFLGVVTLTMLLLSNAMGIWRQLLMSRFSNAIFHNFTLKLFAFYLQQPYAFHLQKNSAHLLNNLTGQLSRAIAGLFAYLTLFLSVFGVACLLLVMMLVDPIIALSTVAVFALTYGLIYTTLRRKIEDLSEQVSRLSRQIMTYYSEALGGIKELNVLRRQHHYLHRFERASLRRVEAVRYVEIRTGIAKPVIEMIAFGGIVLVTLYYLNQGARAATIVPILALYGFAGYRLLPALQGIFGCITAIKFHSDAMEFIGSEFANMQAQSEMQGADGDAVGGAAVDGDGAAASLQSSEPREIPAKAPAPQTKLALSLQLRDVSYHYPNASAQAADNKAQAADKKTQVAAEQQPRGGQSFAIRNFSHTFAAKTSTGIVGKSGAGKSTLVDIILGLLPLKGGEILIDGTTVMPGDRAGVERWQGNIGYVPQTIFLADTSIACNIAFGMAADEIDHAAVVRAAQMANIDEFVMRDCQQGYETIIGERGIRLSGGQRQRIGIARALYHDPEVLILDEATSALDSPTEQAIMNEVHILAGSKTILIIAHRFTTLKNCEQIIVMENGRLVEVGSYDDLDHESVSFKVPSQTQDTQSDICKVTGVN